MGKEEATQEYSVEFIRDQFAITETSLELFDGSLLTACGGYWNQGNAGIAVAVCFDTLGGDEKVRAWKAYLGAMPTTTATVEEVTHWVRRNGVKLFEHEARNIMANRAGVLSALPYWR